MGAGLINDRWVDILEDDIYRELSRLRRADWGLMEFEACGPPAWAYLRGGPYAYPYSLPPEVINRLAARLNEEGMMLDWKGWIDKFIENPGYNDGIDYGVIVSDVAGAKFEVLGVHHLTPDENRGLHNVFIDVLDKNNQRLMGATVAWNWSGHSDEPPPIRIDKPASEISDLPIFAGMLLKIWHPEGNGVMGIHTNHPDEPHPSGERWNTIGHHSFLVVFREISEPAPPPPDPEPEPKETVLLVKKSWLDSQEVDERGFIVVKM